jgi:hypothetical protein
MAWSLIKWCWSDSGTQPNLAYAVRWYRQTLGALLAVISVAHVAIGLYALPARREADPRVEQYIRQGEMSFVCQTSTQSSSTSTQSSSQDATGHIRAETH